MDHDFWLRRWSKGDIGFHRDAVHTYLARDWTNLGLAKGSTVLVPLCGKSHDMIWLAEQGHKVVGVELSPIAVADFFAEQNLSPDTREEGTFTVSKHGDVEIWCGDLFNLPFNVWRDVDAVYDRASLVALPEDLQEKFVHFLAEQLPAISPIFLITLAYDPSEMSGPPFNISNDRVRELFAVTHDITHLHSRDGMEDNARLKDRGVTSLQESLHVLKRV